MVIRARGCVVANQSTFRSIAEELMRRIEKGELRAGEMLPSEPTLSAELA